MPKNILYLFKKLFLYLVYLSILSCAAALANTSNNSSVLENFHYCIEGVSGTVLKTVHLKLKELKRSSAQLTKHNVHSHYLASKKEIYNALQALGYFQANIQSHLGKTKHCYFANYTITLGPALTITRLNIDLIGPGQEDANLKLLINKLTIKKGYVMSTANYQILKRRLYKILIAEGYLDAKWKQHTVIIDPVQYTATIKLSLETGFQYKIGSITFSKNPLSADFLKSYVTFQKNAPYRLQEVQQLETTLKNSGYFEKVTIKKPSNLEKTEIPINVELTPVPKNYHAIRVGYNTGLGLQIKAEKLIRYINNRGHQVFLMGKSSFAHPINILGLYTIPGHLPTIQQYHLQYEYNQQNLVDTPTKISTLSLLSVRQYRAATLTAFLKYHHETFSKQSLPTIDHCTRLFIQGFIARIAQMHWLESSHNYDLQLHTQIALKKLFSKADLFKVEYKFNYFGEYSKYLNWWRKQSYLLCRARIGYIFTPFSNTIPPSLDFYAGGLHYPRGHHEYRAPNYLLTYTLEYRHCLKSLFYLNFFTDVHPQFFDNNSQFASSSGIGLALWTPNVGTAEVSLVYKKSNLFKPSWNIVVKISDEL